MKRLAGSHGVEQKGFALLAVLILMLVGSLVIAPLLHFMGTGINTTMVYNAKSQELYAADAGIEDGRWLIEKDKVGATFPGPNPPKYDPFDYFERNGYGWSYDLAAQTGRTVNGYSVNVTLRNMWMPDLPVPDAVKAKAIIQGTMGNPPKLVMTGAVVDLPGANTTGTYKIKITYSGGDALSISSLGIWLPPGFTYHAQDSNNLVNLLGSGQPKMYATEPWPPADHKSGQAVVWTFNNYPFSGNVSASQSPFPGVDFADAPDLVSTVTFQFDGPEGANPAAVAWMNTNLDLGGGLTYSWDGDKKVFQIVSTAGGTTVEAYNIKTELREMAAAIQGDYYATGNSLMTNSHSDNYYIRDQWINADHSSSNSVSQESSPGAGNGVPLDGEVKAAYLYWTSWFHESQKSNVHPLDPDTCSSFTNWDRSGSGPYLNTSWGGDGDVFEGHFRTGGVDPYRYLTLKNGTVDLSAYSQGLATVSWDHGVSLVAAGLADTCGNFNNWSQTPTPNAWSRAGSNPSYYFTGHYNTGNSRSLTLNSDQNLDGFSEGQVTVSWKQWETFTSNPVSVFSDACSNFGDWTQSGTIWRVRSNGGNNYFRGRNYSASGSLDIVHNEPLQTYASGGTVTLSWDQWVNGAESGDGLDVDLFNGTTWTAAVYSVRGSFGGTQHQSIPVPSTYLTSGFRVRFHLVGFTSDNNEDFNIDGINISYAPTGPGPDDGLDISYYGDNGTNWSTPIPVFRGTLGTARPSANNMSLIVPGQYLTDQFRVRLSLVGFGTSGQSLNLDDITITCPPPPDIGPADGLDFSFSGDNGANWSANIQAFREHASPSNFSYAVPSAYLTGQFKMRFYLVGFGGNGQYCTIDNVKITVGNGDTSVFFKINGTQVYFDANGIPRQGAQPISADHASVINNVLGTNPRGFSYASYKDVTALVQTFSPSPTGQTNRPGIATYTVGGVDGTLGNDSQPGDGYQLAHAGWSLIIVYSSPQTLGHQLYLFDRFSFDDDFADLDFDRDTAHLPGGDIRGFIVPDRVPGEAITADAAKMTIMVGEGDDFIAGSSGYPGDFVAFNAPSNYWTSPAIAARDISNNYKLWDGKDSLVVSNSNTSTSPNNVWNGLSTAFNADGIDVDTFHIHWDSNHDGAVNTSDMLSPGDISARIDLCTAQDNWNLVYIILSFRSKATTGGSVTYLIR